MREHLSHNVVLNLIIAACCGLADSIWTGTIGVAFISDVWHTNKRVGIATALTGLAALASALPAGWAADRYGRAKVCRVGSLAILVAAPAYAYATLRATEGKDRELAYILICIASAFFGLSSGIINGPAQALLADSVSTGARSKVYTWLFACYIVPSVLGPAISVGYFEAHGDEWRLPLLRDLTLLGMALEVPVAILCCCFRDDKALGSDSDAVQDQEHAAASASAPGDDGDDAGRPKASDAENDAEAPPDDQCDERDDAVDPRIKMIPYVVFCTDLVVALGSGCTIKFFPLWFKDDLHMSPAAVQGIYCGVPLSMALASGFCTALSRRIGRVEAVLSVRSVALVCFVGMLVVFYQVEGAWRLRGVVALYILRTALMNCTYPVEESILMDYVPKNTRARWKSLESVSQFGWCGSALAGGLLADKYGYARTFAITICLQASGVLCYSRLLGVVAREKAPEEPSPEEPLREPLLNEEEKADAAEAPGP